MSFGQISRGRRSVTRVDEGLGAWTRLCLVRLASRWRHARRISREKTDLAAVEDRILLDIGIDVRCEIAGFVEHGREHGAVARLMRDRKYASA